MNYNFTYLGKAIEAIENEDLDFENYKSPFFIFSLTEDFDLEVLFEKELKLNILNAGNEANKNGGKSHSDRGLAIRRIAPDAP